MIERTPGTFVLGDLGPVARMATTSDLVNPIVPGTTLSIYLPVSSGFVLCGHREEIEEDVDADALNLASVELSRDLFVAGRNTERERNYVKALGRRCQLLESTELDLKLFEFPS